MRSSIIVIVSAGLLGLVQGPSSPRKVLTEQAAVIAKASRPAAEEAVKQFEELVNDENFRSMGFETADEVKAAELGRPLPLVVIHLNELQNYKPGDDPYPLMHMVHRVIYPVLVKGQVRSGVEVHQKDGKWQPTSFGLADSVRRYSIARERHAAGDQSASYFLVKVQSLNQTYLGHETEKGLRLVHVRDQAVEKHKLEAQPAAEVLAGLVQAAKEHDGQPR
jgi:hypothetical protein